MNGAKVLNRLLQLFVLFNLILCVINISKHVNAYVLSAKRIENIQAICESKGIILKTQLPRAYTPKKAGTILVKEMSAEESNHLAKGILNSALGEMTISTEAHTQESSSLKGKKNRVYSKGNETLRFKGEDIIYTSHNKQKQYEKITVGQAQILCDGFIKRLSFSKTFNQGEREVKEKEGGIELTYYARFEHLPLFNSYLRFWVTDRGIEEAIIHVAQVDANKEVQTKKNIYPIDLVLFGIEEEIPIAFNKDNPIYITDISLGYYTLTTEGMRILAEEIIPTYKITIEGLKEPLFVNAYTNKSIK
ncbi:hypothetical protein CS063_12015 [Sporanaerobium hydrogeniformans]|uniref:Uncharacterized protein n=1 Tax=Sporanaerobium hydrogeniformans TaxID=3072179 RepID=A0AC61DAW0_9FIRM|nr:hypothetical protein [Sporanaerobium hydrogeniformans]PHV70197.1 hypothetical protein CS063_12015 [Sporanaerobium hydrogeniformans]